MKKIHIAVVGAGLLGVLVPITKRHIDGLPLLLSAWAYLFVLYLIMEISAKDGRWYACWRRRKENIRKPR